MLTIDRLSGKPIYEQVVEQVECLIARGVLAEGNPLPSVRSLAVELTINPNTLQRAYMELERRGLCVASPGSGRYVAPGARGVAQNQSRAGLDELTRVVCFLARRGIARARLHQCIDAAFEGALGEEGGHDRG